MARKKKKTGTALRFLYYRGFFVIKLNVQIRRDKLPEWMKKLGENDLIRIEYGSVAETPNGLLIRVGREEHTFLLNEVLTVMNSRGVFIWPKK